MDFKRYFKRKKRRNRHSDALFVPGCLLRAEDPHGIGAIIAIWGKDLEESHIQVYIYIYIYTER